MLNKPPSLIGVYLRALGKRISRDYVVGAPLPRLKVTLAPMEIETQHLAKYRSLCQCKTSIPALYPQVMSFTLQMSLLTHRLMPFPVMGLVHLSNRVEVLQEITLENRHLAFTCSVGEQRTTSSGVSFDIITHALNERDEVIWLGVATFLYRCKTDISKTSSLDSHNMAIDGISQCWQLPKNLGRRYGRISKDLNPIHLSRLSANLFGFKRCIVHGLWLNARCIGALESSLPEAPYAITCRFMRPIYLPRRVLFYSLENSEGIAVQVWSDNKEDLHFTAKINKLVNTDYQKRGEVISFPSS
jgi:MaoC like domain